MKGRTMEFLVSWLSTAIAIALAIALVPGIRAVGGSYLGPAACALALALVNAIIAPVAQFFSLPITVLTLGIFYLIVNALLLELAAWAATGIFGSGIAIDGFGSALLGSIVISIVSAIANGIIGKED